MTLVEIHAVPIVSPFLATFNVFMLRNKYNALKNQIIIDSWNYIIFECLSDFIAHILK